MWVIADYILIKMKREENYSNCRVRTSEEDEKSTSRPTETRREGSREKSIPKFNRKTEMRPFTRKKSETNLAIEPICFISPKRNIQPHNSMFKSTRFEDIAHNFSASIFETPTERSSDLSLTSCFNQSTVQSRVTTIRSRESDDEAESYKLELDSLKLEIEKVLKENATLKSKVEDFNSLQSFLVERETYIF